VPSSRSRRREDRLLAGDALLDALDAGRQCNANSRDQAGVENGMDDGPRGTRRVASATTTALEQAGEEEATGYRYAPQKKLRKQATGRRIEEGAAPMRVERRIGGGHSS